MLQHSYDNLYSVCVVSLAMLFFSYFIVQFVSYGQSDWSSHQHLRLMDRIDSK